jgi:hypothetical protein
MATRFEPKENVFPMATRFEPKDRAFFKAFEFAFYNIKIKKKKAVCRWSKQRRKKNV